MGKEGEPARSAFRAFLISDIRGYSSFAAARGDEAAAALTQRFITIAEDVMPLFGGLSVGNRGDEVLIAFESPRQAIRAALAFQQRLLDATREDPDLPMPAGVGIDAGEAVVVPDGWRANAINVAARLCSIAKGGEILVTPEVAHLAQAIDAARYTQRPAVTLKGIARPVRPVRVTSESVDAARAFAQLGHSRAAHTSGPRRVPQRWAVAGALAAVLASAAVGASLLAGGGAGSSELAADVVGGLDGVSGQVKLALPVRDPPTGIAVGRDGAIWTTSTSAGTLSRIDPRTRVTTRLAVGHEPIGVALAPDGSAWVANSGDGTVSQVSSDDGSVVRTVHVGAGPTELVAAGTWLWVANTLDASVEKIDLNSGRVLSRIPVGSEPAGIAAGGNSIWVADQGDGTVYRLDERSGSPLMAPVAVGGGPTHVAYGDGAAWVTNGINGSLSRIDGQSSAVTSARVGQGPFDVAVGPRTVWVSDEFGNAVAAVDPRTLAVTRTIKMSSAPLGLTFAGGRLWVAADGVGASAHRGGVLYLAASGLAAPNPGDPPNLDPGSAYLAGLWRVLVMTGDGLVGYARVGGVAGNALVPDLAASLPTPTDNGRTYVFRIRTGIRYSSGTPLRASDFRRGLERAFKVGGGPTQYFDGLLGGSQCVREPKSCTLAKGVVADDAAGTVTFHLTKPDPDFLYQLTLPAADPVPPGTPVQLRSASVPGTGPYEVSSYQPSDPSNPRSRGRLVLRRNPFFRQWSAAAQPAGYPDRIVITTSYSLSAEIAAVQQGRADLGWDSPPPVALDRLRASLPSQLHINAANSVGYIWMNSRRPPFNDVLARRAFNYAVNRQALISIARGSPFSGSPTCQMQPPNFPGFVRYCPYTLDPTASGRWLAPDLAKARALVSESGTKGDRVTFVQASTLTPRFGRALVATLRSIGFRARLELLALPKYFQLFDTPPSHSDTVEAGLDNWLVDYLAPSNVLSVILTCSAIPQALNLGGFCDHSLDARMHRALSDQEQRAGVAAEEWHGIDKLAVDEAASLPFVNAQSADFVSRRVGDYQHNPQWGVLIDQLWVR